ncbi:MAG: hypothetical protein J6B33_03130 [Prevotella sp.]|nr:hypothetical protein [Prevotella sp.]
MKKFSFLLAATAALVLASCGGKKTDANQESKDSVSFEQSQIEQKVMAELDSVADIYNSLNPVEGVFANGKIQLSDEELKAKPAYLYDLKNIDNLSLLSQKYRALGVLAVDAKVAEIYKMDSDAYAAAIAKIATDVNDPAVKFNKDYSAEDLKAFYAAEKENGRLNFFWEASAAAVVENLFVLSQNVDKFLPAFDDKSASEFSYHVALLKLSLDDLAEYDTHIKELVDILAPLNELNAINVDQLKEQIGKMKPQIETARAQMLK